MKKQDFRKVLFKNCMQVDHLACFTTGLKSNLLFFPANTTFTLGNETLLKCYRFYPLYQPLFLLISCSIMLIKILLLNVIMFIVLCIHIRRLPIL